MAIWYFTDENEEILWTNGFGKSPLELENSTLYVIPVGLSIGQIDSVTKLKVVIPEPLTEEGGQALNHNSRLLAKHELGTGSKHTQYINAKTANYTLLATDTAQTFINTGAAGLVNFTLPLASSGLTYTFIVEANQTLKITATNNGTIQVGNNESFVNGNVETDIVGSVIKLLGISDTEWIATSAVNVWTVT